MTCAMDAFVDAFLKACPQPPPPPPLPPGLGPDPVPLRKAAVLVPLFEHAQDGKIHCLLTVRPSHMRRHAGEVCLPGGKIDEGDVDAVAAALREAEEEIGLPRDLVGVKVVGTMTPALSLHLMEVTPVVAVIPADFVPRPNPEVTYILLPRKKMDDEPLRTSGGESMSFNLIHSETSTPPPLPSRR